MADKLKSRKKGVFCFIFYFLTERQYYTLKKDKLTYLKCSAEKSITLSKRNC